MLMKNVKRPSIEWLKCSRYNQMQWKRTECKNHANIQNRRLKTFLDAILMMIDKNQMKDYECNNLDKTNNN